MSRTKRTKSLLLTVLGGFVVTLGAGMVVGMAAGWHEASTKTVPAPTTQPTPPPGRVPPLSEALGLTKEQSEQMKDIWSGMPAQFQKSNERRMALVKERDEALYDLLTDEQKARYQKLKADYSTKLNNLAAEQAKEREAAFQDAVERTKKILTEPQREKYEELLKKHGPAWHRGEHGGHGEHGGPAPFQPRDFGNGQPHPGGPRGDRSPGWSGNRPRGGEAREPRELRGERGGPKTQSAPPAQATPQDRPTTAPAGAAGAADGTAEESGDAGVTKNTSRPAGVAP